jgi:hypothetical protein
VTETLFSQQRQELNEIVHIAPLRMGMVPKAERGKDSPEIRYIDRLGAILDLYNAGEEQGFPSVIRIFRGIHTAKWALIDGDTRLMLSVVFDGDWYDYLRGLALTVPALLDSIWSNCEGWRSLEKEPDKRLFDFIRRYQVKARFFYAHHPALSVREVDTLTVSRDALKKIKCTAEHHDCRALVQEKIATKLAPRPWDDRQQAALAEYEAGQKETGGPGIAQHQAAFRAVVGTLYEAKRFNLAFKEAFGEAIGGRS